MTLHCLEVNWIIMSLSTSWIWPCCVRNLAHSWVIPLLSQIYSLIPSNHSLPLALIALIIIRMLLITLGNVLLRIRVWSVKVLQSLSSFTRTYDNGSRFVNWTFNFYLAVWRMQRVSFWRYLVIDVILKSIKQGFSWVSKLVIIIFEPLVMIQGRTSL